VEGYGGVGAEGGSNWFNSEVVRKVGNGNKTSFWNHVWLGDGTLRSRYPRHFAISNQEEACIGEMREVPGVSGWFWRWNFFVWEENLFANMLNPELLGSFYMTGFQPGVI